MMAVRLLGGLMMVYAALYLAQYIGSTLYDNPQQVWDVMNYASGVFILVALVVNALRVSSARALFYANAALAIWYFRNWLDLLTLDKDESVSVHADVVWSLIAVMIPLVLATTGWRLWRGRSAPARSRRATDGRRPDPA